MPAPCSCFFLRRKLSFPEQPIGDENMVRVSLKGAQVIQAILVGAAVAAAIVAATAGRAWAQSGPSGHESRGMIDLQNQSLDRSDKPATYRRLGRITYPQNLMDAKVEGVVYVKASVDETGNVLTAVVDRVDPPEAAALGEPAVEGVRNWAFEPARKQGKPVVSDEIVPVVFALDRQASPKITGATLG
ncbi:MAG TPA: energy transducer TonB, partial [Rhodanobacteraceae bacterium]|nr:energy transducer TonB [Rhodanobacteraceae bacterium]